MSDDAREKPDKPEPVPMSPPEWHDDEWHDADGNPVANDDGDFGHHDFEDGP